MQIIWSPEAEETFDSIITFITEHWGISSSKKFIKQTKKLLKTLATMPQMFPLTDLPNVRRAVIAPQTSLFYEVQSDHIGLLFFWDNRQDPIL